ncbi:MAG: hypothetical protein ACT4QC_20960 [Planctomycetaceae bacterium]
MPKGPATSPAPETEDQLVAIAQEAVSHCRWVVGECASKWTERYARGRTDADFAALIGVTADQVYQRRRVWEAFAGVREQYPALKWSHFYAALAWDDAADCLRWAADMQATVAEMRAWRRAQRGEDLTAEALPEEAVRFLPADLAAVQMPAEATSEETRGAWRPGASAEAPAIAGVARQARGDDDYAPFRSDAGSPPPAGGHGERPAPAALSTEQVAKRLAGTFEKCAKLLTAEFWREFRRLPEPVREKFRENARELQSRLSQAK